MHIILKFITSISERNTEKPKWLLKINFFFKFSIHNGIFEVHLIDIDGLVRNIGKEDENGFSSSNMNKCFIIIQTFNPSQSFSHKPIFFCVWLPQWHPTCFGKPIFYQPHDDQREEKLKSKLYFIWTLLVSLKWQLSNQNDAKTPWWTLV